ncbi:hypothetical protein K8Q94_01920 [Candidatus Nomurabacteria bacterium]|nr:hypothetical protein [Candidatus Nomurabacteria bacterium]
MFEENKTSKTNSIKDTTSIPAPYQAEGFGSGSYSKTNKLISALYMVTDIMDTDEPIRIQLRTLAVEIISDTFSTFKNNGVRNVKQILSLLDIAFTVHLISEMNHDILKREFVKLHDSLIEFSQDKTHIFLDTLLQDKDIENSLNTENKNNYSVDKKDQNKGQLFVKYPIQIPAPVNHQTTRLGVQKGSTLLKALTDKMPLIKPINNFDKLKKDRQSEIVNILKDLSKGQGKKDATIAEIKDIVKSSNGHLSTCGEKTLQRELVAMVNSGVLKKAGEKRWSKYSIN